MKVNQISYSRTFHLGDSNFEKLSIDIELEEGDTEEGAYTHAKKVVEDNKMKESEAFAILSKGFQQPKETQIEKERSGLSRQEALLMDIESCTDIKVLETYKLITKNNEILRNAFLNRLHQLVKK